MLPSLLSLESKLAWPQVRSLITERIQTAVNDKSGGISNGLDEYVYDKVPEIGIMRPIIHLSDTAHGNVPPIVKQKKLEHDALLDNYLKGKATAEDVSASVTTLFQTMLNVNIANNLISGNDPEENKEVVLATWHDIKNHFMQTLMQTNDEEGLLLARKQGIREPLYSYSWLYYNADYYYFDQELSAIAMKAAHELAVKNGFKADDFDKAFRKRCVDTPFNVYWSARNQLVTDIQHRNAPVLNSGKLIDPALSPPKGFKFFYSEHVPKIEKQKGVWYKRVMIVNQQTVTKSGSFDGKRFNAFDFWGDAALDDASVLGYVKNFDIYRNILGVPVKENPSLSMVLDGILYGRFSRKG